MPKNILAIFFIFFASLQAISQEKFTISGVVSDSRNKETLIGVSVYIQETKTGIVTNEYGFYSITLPKGDYTISTSYVGYTCLFSEGFLKADRSESLQYSPLFMIGVIESPKAVKA